MGLGDWVLLILDVVAFALSLIIGWQLIYHHSKFPDTSVGYHFSSAMRDEKRWEWANVCAGRLSILLGVVLLLVLPALVRVLGASLVVDLIVFIAAACAWAALVVFLPDRLLRRKFGDK